jgi:phenylalanyl-tRNA synthetase beta chain
MKFSKNWLREWVNPTLSTDELVQRLTMAGLEVNSVEPVAAPFSQVVVGSILSVKAHPDAKKLNICQVDVGKGKHLKIVCGAPNVHAGMIVPTALIGAHLGEMKIKKAKLRGVPSFGLLCSAKELGMAESSEGLMLLPDDAPIGEDIRRYLQLDDVCLEIDLTPNRGDCLSIKGIAREVGVLTRREVLVPSCSPVATTMTDTFPVEIHTPQACPRYVGRIIKGINTGASTPLWMQERLRRSGLRNIRAVVDVTNYVLLELGQPMHAFDLDCLSGGIQVRTARAGESLTLLDEQTVELDEQTLVIADHKQPLAMAGVMGGQASAVTSVTQDIFLESAFFAQKQAMGCARRYGLHTESSHRFERGVDPQLQSSAMERATALLLDIVGGQPGPVIDMTADLPGIPTINLRKSRIKHLLGRTIGRTIRRRKAEDILSRLGMQLEPVLRTHSLKKGHLLVKPKFEGWHVQPPSFRFDISLEVDLIEELARVHGYNNLPSHAAQSRLTIPPQPAVTLERIQAVLVQRDYQEAITYSFVDSEQQAQLNPDVDAVSLANPIASDMTVMRTTLWTGLLQALLYNRKRQQSRVRLFETGLRFLQSKEQGLPLQEAMIAGVVTGTCWSEQWGQKGQVIDFFDVKADVEALLNLTRRTESADVYRFTPDTHPALHSGQTAAIYRGDELIGLLGAVHPRLIQTLELTPPVYLFELRLAPLCQAKRPQFKEISKYPSMRRDIAVLVSEEVSAAQLLDCIQHKNIETLIDLQLFDVYQGEGIEPGKKSLAMELIFQAFSRNLTDSEVDTVVEQILGTLEQHLGAQLRK